MDSPGILLTWPGEWLVERLFAGDFPTPGEARADLAITLGIACWAAACLLLAVAWRVAAPRLRKVGRASAPAALQRVRRPGVTWRQAWGAAWRAWRFTSPSRPRLRDRDGWAAKGLWAGLTLGWIGWWRLGYRRRHHPELP